MTLVLNEDIECKAPISLILPITIPSCYVYALKRVETFFLTFVDPYIYINSFMFAGMID